MALSSLAMGRECCSHASIDVSDFTASLRLGDWNFESRFQFFYDLLEKDVRGVKTQYWEDVE